MTRATETPKPKERGARDCAVCGGDGWTDGSAELRRDGREGDTTCIACEGSGKEPAPKRAPYTLASTRIPELSNAEKRQR